MGVILSFIQGFGLFGSTFIIPYTRKVFWVGMFSTGMLMIPSTLYGGFYDANNRQVYTRRCIAKYLIAGHGHLFYIQPYELPDNQHRQAPTIFFWPLMIRGIGLGLFIGTDFNDGALYIERR